MIYSLPKIIQNQTPKMQRNMAADRNFLRWDTSHIWNNRQEPSSLWGTLASSSSTVLPSYAKLIKWSKKHRDPYGRSRNSLCNEMSGYALYIYTTCRWHGSCRTCPKNANSHVICKVKKQKMHKSRVICKVHRKKSHDMGPLHPKNAKNVMSTNSHTVHFTSHMNKDSIWVYDYLLAVGIIQNYTSAVRIFQSHMNPFTSLFYIVTI